VCEYCVFVCECVFVLFVRNVRVCVECVYVWAVFLCVCDSLVLCACCFCMNTMCVNFVCLDF